MPPDEEITHADVLGMAIADWGAVGWRPHGACFALCFDAFALALSQVQCTCCPKCTARIRPRSRPVKRDVFGYFPRRQRLTHLSCRSSSTTQSSASRVHTWLTPDATARYSGIQPMVTAEWGLVRPLAVHHSAEPQDSVPRDVAWPSAWKMCRAASTARRRIACIEWRLANPREKKKRPRRAPRT